MKKSHIIALVVIAVAIASIISMIGDASTYSGFEEAKVRAKNGDKTAVHVVGELSRDTEGNFIDMEYNPMENPNIFQFSMTDSLQVTSKVLLLKPKPQDLDKSEKVVVIGSMNLEKNIFEAEDILLKCPSKYNNSTESLSSR